MIFLAEQIVMLTFTGAESIFLVNTEVGCGGTPWQVIRTSVSGAGGVRFALKCEGEVAHGTFSIPIAGLDS